MVKRHTVISKFWLFSINQKYAETTLIIDEKYTSKKPLTQPNKVLKALSLQKPV